MTQRKALRLLSIAFVLFFLSTSVYAQNTKGDKAETNGGARQNRFKGKPLKRSKAPSYKTPSYKSNQPRRVVPGRSSTGNTAIIRMKPRRPSESARVSQSSRFINNNSRTPKNERAGGRSGGSRPVVRSRSGKTQNVFRQFGQFTNNSEREPKRAQRPVSNRATLARLDRLQSTKSKPPIKKRKVIPRSASRSFIRHKTINANAGFWNIRKKGEQAVTTDIAGHPLRARNYHTPSPAVIPPTTKPYYGRKRVGDKPYEDNLKGRVSATPQADQRAWRGDIAGRRLRSKNFTSKASNDWRPRGSRLKPRSSRKTGAMTNLLPSLAPGIGSSGLAFKGKNKGLRSLKGGGSRSGKLWNNNGVAVQGRQSGLGGNRIGAFRGNIKTSRPLKGGGSVSGRPWNNNGVALQGRQSGLGNNRIGTFQGNIKTGRPLKGGGSRSGQLWNNKGTAIRGRQSEAGDNGIGTFQGNIKTGRPLKGGGSVSGRGWNNKGTAIRGRQSEAGDNGIGTFQGNIKTSRPLKGGGSVSGRGWNNKGTAIDGRQPGIGGNRIGTFQGNIKGGKILKGGGSISGTTWNNKASAIQVKQPLFRARKEALYKGSLKQFEETPGYNNQGEEFTGFIKLPRIKKGYIQNPNAAEESIVKRRPNNTTYQVDGLQIEVKRRDYVVNKNLNENASRKLKPTDATRAVANLQVKVKQYHYIHNNSSAKAALNVREPGKAFARATDYQGNIRMKNLDKLSAQRKRELHPDAQFVKIEKNNVAEERDLLTNLKLWWGRNFRKSETQPDHLKEKIRKPRYDKGEEGMWHD